MKSHAIVQTMYCPSGMNNYVNWHSRKNFRVYRAWCSTLPWEWRIDLWPHERRAHF